MLKLKDAVQIKVPVGHGRVGDIQAIRKPNAIHPDGLALVRFMGSQVKRWFRISDLTPLTWLND
jgi:hypothetical protein